MKKVLVTGATGFIGRHCLPLLEKRGYAVIPVSSQVCNLLNNSDVEKLVSHAKPTHLLHLAWMTIPGQFWNSEENLQWLESGRYLLETFQKTGGHRVVVAGTCAEYDLNNTFLSEFSAPINPQSLYGKCKNDLHLFLQKLRLSYCWARIFSPYGPFEHQKKLIPSVILSLLRGEEALCTHGNQVRDFMYIEDIAAALVEILDTDIEGPLNVASGHPVVLKDLCLKIGNKLEKPHLLRLGAIPAPPHDPLSVVADVTRLSKELQWNAKVDLETGLEKTVAWWKHA